MHPLLPDINTHTVLYVLQLVILFKSVKKTKESLGICVEYTDSSRLHV